MGERFLWDILRFYGDNSSLSMTNFENFLELITSRRAAASVSSEANPLRSAEVKLTSRVCLLELQLHALFPHTTLFTLKNPFD